MFINTRLPGLPVFLALAASLLLCSCGIDVMGIFVSSGVKDRVAESAAMAQPAAPQPEDSGEFSFMIVGDPHYWAASQSWVDELLEQDMYGCDFLIVVGDIVQDGKMESFILAKEQLDRFNVPVYPLIGNHDIYFGGYRHYANYFGPTRYSFTISDNLFVMLDTANGTLGEEQKNWLENILENSGCENVFVFSHYGIISSGFQRFVEWSLVEEKYQLIDLLDRHNADYFFSGHLHAIELWDIRDVKYRGVNQISDKEGAGLKITVSGTEISETLVFINE